MTEDKGSRRSDASGYYRVADGFRAALPGIARLLMVGDATGSALQLKQRGPMDWICVVKRVNFEGESQVLFGMGVGPIEALGYADGQVQAGKWREDKPWVRKSDK